MLHLAVEAWTDPGTISFYSNGASGVGWSGTTDFSRGTMHRALFSAEPYGPVPPNPDDPYVRTITGGTAHGRLTGGCLGLVQTTLGTSIEIDTRDRIIYLEDVGHRHLPGRRRADPPAQRGQAGGSRGHRHR